MARAFTAQKIIDRGRTLANQKFSRFVDATEELEILSEEYADFYDLLLLADPDQIQLSYYTIPVTGAERYALPADFYALVGVERKRSDRWSDLAPYSVADRNVYGGPGSEASHYRQDGSGVELRPYPPGGEYRAVYFPTPADITNLATTIDGIAGWEGYMVRAFGLRLAIKEGVPATIAGLRAEKDAYLRALLERVSNRKPTTTPRVRDVRETFGVRDPASYTIRGGSLEDEDY